jgi:hypothetical protein
MNLTPEQLRAIQAQYTSTSGWTPAMNGAANLDGMAYQRADDQYYGYDPNKKETGDPFQKYGMDGSDQGQGQFHDSGNGLDLLAMGALAALTMGYGLPALMGGGGAAAGGGAAVAGDAFMPGMLGAGGSEVAFGSVIPGLESFVLPAAGGAAGGAAGASGANPGYSFMGGDATMPGALGANGVNMSTAALPGMSGNLANGAGSSLLSGGAKSLLGPAATLLGGAAGAQGQENEQSTTRDVPEWLKPYVTKNLEYAGGLLDKQMQPGYLQGYDDMRTRGQSLLNAPMAGNGFSKFFPGR